MTPDQRGKRLVTGALVILAVSLFLFWLGTK